MGFRRRLAGTGRGATGWAGLALGLFFSLAHAGDPHKTPDQIPGAVRVDAEDLVELLEKRPSLIIIDARVAEDRRFGYLEGSVSLPDTDTTCASLARVVPRKSHPVLFYCNGVKCGRSVKSINIAMKCGYQDIYWFRGGFEEWKTKDYPYLKD